MRQARELTIDFVYHGDEGLAGPWAVAARAWRRDRVLRSRWRLRARTRRPTGTCSSATRAHCQRSPPRSSGFLPAYPPCVFAEVEDAAEEQPLECAGDLEVTWVHRSGPAAGAGSPEPSGRPSLPTGAVHAFVHGDAGFVREVRRHLRAERGVPREAMSVSGYWRRGRTEEGWRAEKPDWKRDVEQRRGGARRPDA